MALFRRSAAPTLPETPADYVSRHESPAAVAGRILRPIGRRRQDETPLDLVRRSLTTISDDSGLDQSAWSRSGSDGRSQRRKPDHQVQVRLRRPVQGTAVSNYRLSGALAKRGAGLVVTFLAVGALVALSPVFLARTRHVCVLPFDSSCDAPPSRTP